MRSDGGRVPRRLAASRTSPSTTSSARPSRGTAQACRNSSAASARPAISTRGSTKGGTASRVRRSSRRRIWSRACADPPHETGLDPREELLLPAVEVSGPAAGVLLRTSRVPGPRGAAERDPQADRGWPRGYFGQPGGAVLGHPDATGSVERGVRVVRRPHQLHQRGRLGTDDALLASGGRPICMSSGRTSRASIR